MSLKPLSTIIHKHPLALLPTFWEDLEDQLKEGFSQKAQSGLTISEDKDTVHVEADMPGMKLEHINISIHKGVLSISSEQEEEKESPDRKFYVKAQRSYSYRITVPGEIDDHAEPQAEYKDGVLKVTFKKAKQDSYKKITVKKA